MFEKTDAMHTVGIEFENHVLKIAQLSLFKGKPHLEKVFETTVFQEDENPSETSHVKPLYMEEDGKKNLLELLEKNLFVTVLQTNEVLIRPLEIKLKKDKDIDAVIPFQVEPLLPYPIENAIIDRIKISKQPESNLLTFLAVRQDYLSQHLDFWHRLEIEPEVISCIPAALATFAKVFAPTDGFLLILHLGWKLTTCTLINGGKLIAAQSFQMGISNLQQAYLEDMYQSEEGEKTSFFQLNFASLNAQETPILVDTKERMHLEVMRLIYALTKQSKGKEINEIMITGDAGELQNLSETLCANLNKHLLNPMQTPEFPLSSFELQKYAISIGAALSALPKEEEQVNFRQQQFTYPNPWKRFKKPLAIFFGLSLLLSSSLYFLGESFLKYRENTLKREYVNLLVLMNKPYNRFESEYLSKNPQSHPDQKVSLEDLPLEEIQRRVQYLDKELLNTPDMFPLLPNVPSVSDTLAWINTLPVLMNINDNNQEENLAKPSVQIDHFDYTLVKRPDQSKKNEKYQVKVEIEFISPTPKQAREFHDILIAPNNFVDPKGEVKWSSNRGKYRTSFFLKDKTIYPSN